MDAVDAAVIRFRRRIGPSVVFDADDARQEAALRVWLAGGEPAAAYRGVVDALRRLMPGFRRRRALMLLPLADDYEGQHLDTPEAILIAKQAAMSLESGKRPTTPTPRPAPKPADPLRDRIAAEARAAALMYSEAMCAA